MPQRWAYDHGNKLGSGTPSQSGDDFRGLGHALGLLIRINLLAIGENVQRARGAHADTHGDFQFTFDVLFQAHGLGFQVVSDETTFDYDFHKLRPHRFSFSDLLGFRCE
jgi:hypothetical protein